jgi:hypothetical protein
MPVNGPLVMPSTRVMMPDVLRGREPRGRTTFRFFGLIRTAGRDVSEVTDRSERIRMHRQGATDKKLARVLAAWSLAGKAQHRRDHVAERHRGMDLMIGCLAQKRFDGPEIIEDPAKFGGRLAIWVAGPGGQPLGQDLGRSAQQDDHIELRMEADLVLLAPSDEQHVRVLGGQQLFDGVLPPPLAAVWQWLAPPVVGVNAA